MKQEKKSTPSKTDIKNVSKNKREKKPNPRDIPYSPFAKFFLRYRGYDIKNIETQQVLTRLNFWNVHRQTAIQMTEKIDPIAHKKYVFIKHNRDL